MSMAVASGVEVVNPLRLRLLGRDQLGSLPQPESMIEATLDHRSVALLIGHWGTAKTFLALDWAACIATGQRWQGRETHPGVVLWIASEGASGLHQRLRAWEAQNGVMIDSESVVILPLPVQFTDPAVFENLRDLVSDLNPSLLVIDTLARCMVGLDENSAKDMGVVVDALYRLRDAAVDCTVLVVHHTGKDKVTTRGSSALEGGVDTVYRISGNASGLKLTRTKRKDGHTLDEHHFQLVQPVGQDSVVLAAVDALARSEGTDSALSTILSTLINGPLTTAQVTTATGLRRSTADKKLRTLELQGRIVNNSDRRTKLWQLASSPG